MKLNRVLVIFKRHAGHGLMNGALARGRRAAGRQRRHEAAIAAVVDALKQRGIAVRLLDRERIGRLPRTDLIVAVGGDGTFIAAAHAAGAIPILGVNSLPESSVGFFCAATAETFARILDRIRARTMRRQALPFLEVRIGNRRLKAQAINDVLFAAASPAETMRYRIAVGKRAEMQKSSGIWIAAGPGSTAAIRSAGGRRLPVASTQIQFLVREPCPAPTSRPRLTRGLLPRGGSLLLEPMMEKAFVYIDGHRITAPVRLRQRLTVRVSQRRLHVFL